MLDVGVRVSSQCWGQRYTQLAISWQIFGSQ